MNCDWIIAHDATKGEDAYAMECLRCRQKQRFALPISVSVWCAAAKAFQKEHRNCQQQAKPQDLVQA
jgi:hypothetical protein